MLDWLNQNGALAPFLHGVVSGTAITIAASAAAFAIGIVLGVALLLARMSPYAPLRGVVMLWVSAIRGTPALLRMLIAYDVVPPLLGISVSPIAAGIGALAGNTSAYIVEILRGALGTLSGGQVAAARALGMRRRDGARTESLFCYPTAPVDALVQALAANAQPSVLLVPEGVAPGREAACAAPGFPLLARLPFVAQPDFDRLLWCADLNFVRGEDSFIRAAWAARPLVWQIYPQEENIHLEKLESWLARYPAPDPAHALIRAWNQPETAQTAAATAQALAPAPWQEWLRRLGQET
ncbi:hypothetical protein G6F24_013918 [Rhizopus arrhizus]|nr:hypothetical protein G6F24_013918 [Rhizopus arrhizus]